MMFRWRSELYYWRKAIRPGQYVYIEIDKNKPRLFLKVILQPDFGEVDVFNPETKDYESYSLKQVFPNQN